MRFNIYDTLRQNRDNNEETLKDKYFDRIADSLDKTQLNQDEKKDIINDNLRLIPYRQRHKFKHEFNKVLKYDDKFNLLYNNDISNAIIKSTINKILLEHNTVIQQNHHRHLIIYLHQKTIY